MDVDSEIEPMECEDIQVDETFENRDLAFITHRRLATEHFEKSFHGNKLSFICGICDRIWFQNYVKRPNAAMLQMSVRVAALGRRIVVDSTVALGLQES
jgi:hypothetical protein